MIPAVTGKLSWRWWEFVPCTWTAKDRSPSDDVVRGTATELDAADLMPGLTICDGRLVEDDKTLLPT